MKPVNPLTLLYLFLALASFGGFFLASFVDFVNRQSPSAGVWFALGLTSAFTLSAMFCNWRKNDVKETQNHEQQP